MFGLNLLNLNRGKRSKKGKGKDGKRYFLVTVYLYNNTVLKKVFTDVAQTDGEFPSRAAIRYSAVVTHKERGFACTHAEIGVPTEITAQERREFEQIPEHISSMASQAFEESKNLTKYGKRSRKN